VPGVVVVVVAGVEAQLNRYSDTSWISVLVRDPEYPGMEPTPLFTTLMIWERPSVVGTRLPPPPPWQEAQLAW